MRIIRSLILAAISMPAILHGAAIRAADADSLLKKVLAGPQRSAEFVARDGARHPYEELRFLGLAPNLTVVEIAPAKGYWTEILGPYLSEHGKLYTAQIPKEVAAQSPGYQKFYDGFVSKIVADKASYATTTITEFGMGHFDIAPPGSADLVFTFRNVHNWMKGGYADAAFAAFYKALKPGGVLGVEEHRAAVDKPQDPAANNGYVREDYVIALAKKAGFEYVGRSDLLNNPRDTKDYPKGVWTLPPTFALGDQDRAKYEAIGEADNFLLKFRKPR